MNTNNNLVDLIKNLCVTRESELDDILTKTLQSSGYRNVLCKKNHWIIAEGSIPVCLIAHLDTVFLESCLDNKGRIQKEFIYDKDKEVLWSPQGAGFDDRAGVAAILQVLKAGYRPHIIFTHDEESGGKGAQSLVKRYTECPFKDCKFLLEIDRQGINEVVYYNNGCEEFQEYIESFGFEKEIGTFSDISIFMRAWEICGANLSAGYIEEHSYMERLYIKGLRNTIKLITYILNNVDNQLTFVYEDARTNYFDFLSFNHDLTCAACCATISPEEDFLEYSPGIAICPKCRKEYCI